MDTIQEINQVNLNLINLDSSGEDTSNQKLIDISGSTKASLDSSFAVNDYNCSSLLDRSNKLDASEDVLDNKMTELMELIDTNNCSDVVKIVNGDGSDSGVEFGGITNSLNETGMLQRALSNNSAGYASSCCCLEEPNCISVSCNSSMISYCSDVYDKSGSTILCGRLSNDYCASEGGSESSSVTGGPVSSLRKSGSIIKKKVAVKEPTIVKSPKKTNETNVLTIRSRSRGSSSGRSASVSSRAATPGTPSSISMKDRARSRDKPSASINITNKTASTPNKPIPPKRPPKPDSFPTGIKDIASPAIQRVTVTRTPSLTRGRTPLATPTTDDGRWPSIGAKGTNTTPRSSVRSGSAAPDGISVKTRVGTLALENKSCPLDKYATLPRRRKEKSADDLKVKDSRSSSVTREQIPNRMTTSLIKKQPSKETPTKTLPAYPRLASASKKVVPKTKIYHETSVQTAITAKDVEDAFSGNAKNIRIDAVETAVKATQSDIRDKEMEKMEEKLKKMTGEYSTLLTKLSEKSQLVTSLEQKLLKEREEKLAAQKELQNNSDRVLGMLESFQTTPGDSSECDSLLILESQLQISGNVLEKKQEEIIKLQNICRSLQRDMEKSLINQDNLLKQKTELEEDSNEMQDFLQAEKVSYMEALKEAESEIHSLRHTINFKEGEIDRQQEDCRHLVRIGEQRRQEYLGMQAKYNALESRSKDILLQQGAAVSGASVALSGLGSRLEHLVSQLIASYNISEQDLEDVIFHNEAYTNSGSSDEGSPDYEIISKCAGNHNDEVPLSPQRGHSFITAVINAIKNATSKAPKTANDIKEKKETPNDESDSTEMLDSETEPCLMMDNVLEDVTIPDSHSHNMVSSSTRISQIEMPSIDSNMPHDESLDNLSQAIANRQQIELQSSIMANNRSAFRQDKQYQMDHNNSHASSLDDEENSCCNEASIAEMPSICEYCNAQSLVDQVIDVDNLITKLLKVLRIVQMDNDHCIQELINNKNKLALTNEENQEKLKEYEKVNFKLKDELKEASQQLVTRGNELTHSKSELVKHRQEIDKLNEDICHLSTFCSNQTNQLANTHSKLMINKDEILNALKLWNEKGTMPEQELISHVVQACNEIPVLKTKLQEKEHQLNDLTNNMSGRRLVMTASWHQAINEAKRQYEAIDRALETLHSIQSIVQQCPALKQLQNDLEETNFQSATTLPLTASSAHLNNLNHNGSSSINLISADLNANQESPDSNGSAGLQINKNDNQVIDSTA